jgi:pilin isopeptide linkage protein
MEFDEILSRADESEDADSAVEKIVAEIIAQQPEPEPAPAPVPEPVPAPLPAEVSLSAEKAVIGAYPSAGSFLFAVLDGDGAEAAGAANDKSGRIAFPVISLPDTGEYYFFIKELNKPERGWTSDGKIYKVKVTVTDEGKPALTAAVDYTDGAPLFVNRYQQPHRRV